ncbi:NAD(P)/FAD-dependent oxidoreductase [Pseudooceanicola sp.]|uniref:NAD(P)/FAD-dependent oxidoreductase n=1 Tax=Pseudooceanicola sp. TaxID=1914328 RepID=UPI004059F9AA
MPRRVAIVGAGIVGAMLARALAGNSAHHVTLIDAAMSAGQGVSGRSFGWITQMAGFSAPPPAAFEARAAGRAAYDDLNAAMENKLFVPGEGALVWRDSAAGTEALIAERRALGTRVEALGPEGIARLAPHLAETPPLAAHAPGDIFLRPGLAAARLAQSAAEMGASLAYGHSVLGVAMQAGRVTGVQLAETIIPADAVVLAAGTGIPRLLPQGATARDRRLPLRTHHALRRRARADAGAVGAGAGDPQGPAGGSLPRRRGVAGGGRQHRARCAGRREAGPCRALVPGPAQLAGGQRRDRCAPDAAHRKRRRRRGGEGGRRALHRLRPSRRGGGPGDRRTDRGATRLRPRRASGGCG